MKGIFIEEVALTYAEEFRNAGFLENECVDAIAKQFRVGKKVVKPLVQRLYAAPMPGNRKKMETEQSEH